MKNKVTFFILFCSISIFSQVGVNTENPIRGVHVAGSTENVRVEGLNALNHSNNLGPGSTSRVYANADGDLTLGGESEISVALLVDTDNYLDDVENPTSVINQVGTNLGYNIAGIPVDGIVGASFTLTRKAILEINYSVSWSIYSVHADEKKRIDDIRARSIQTGIFFVDTAIYDASNGQDGFITHDVNNNLINSTPEYGPWCIDTNPTDGQCKYYGGLLALTGQFYNNASQVRGSFRKMRNTASDYVRLGPGTYTALFSARAQVEETGGFGSAKMYLGYDNDTLQIIAHYYD